MKAKIITSTGETIEFETVEAALKYAAFDETCWPCDVVDADGNVIAHFED